MTTMILRWLLLPLGIAATIWVWMLPDAAGFKDPGQARILCFHLPCAVLSTILVITAGVAGVARLQSERPLWDGRLIAAFELGTLFAVLTLTTGICFSKPQWGDWWHNDPRQTSFLVVCIMLAAGLALRAGLTDDKAKARATAVYAIAIQLPFIFLTFVFPRLPGVITLHPNNTIVDRGIDYYYTSGLLAVGLILGIASYLMFRDRTRLEVLEHELAEAA